MEFEKFEGWPRTRLENGGGYKGRESSRRLQLERRERERERELLRRANYKTASITERDSVPRFSRADRDVPVRMGKEECEGLDRRVVDREPEHRSNHRGAQ